MARFLNFELREFDTATLTGAFQNIGAQLTRAAKTVVIANTSTVDVYITNDGTSNVFRIPAGEELPIPAYDTNFTLHEETCVFREGTQLMARQVTAAAAGAIIVHIFS